MAIEIKAPVLPESVSEGTIAKWYKKPGEAVKRDEHLLDIETDKVVLEIVAPADGVLETIQKKEKDTVNSEEVVAILKEGKPETSKEPSKEIKEAKETKETKEKEPKTPQPKTPPKTATPLSPAARRALAEKETLKNTKPVSEKLPPVSDLELVFEGERAEKRVPMSRLRARIAERLVEAQHTAAILTTFNEVNMHPVMELRQKYKEVFEKTHGVRLGFMSFFTMAVIEALKRFPVVNASIDGNDIIYHGYYDIGIAVSSPRGLVVPVVRNAETLTMAEIEKQIAQFGEKAKAGQLTIEELTGGTFTISNGGVFGSLMSTPILNPPQSAILGMHKIEERPVVENGEIVIRPMMYVALSYDHRIIDGAESVRFLLTIKEVLEEPARLCLGV